MTIGVLRCERLLRRRLDALREAFGDRPVPPITVYEAGGVYFVSDGHPRAALARQEGGAYVDADVTRIQTSHQLHAGPPVASRCRRMATLPDKRRDSPALRMRGCARTV